MIRGTVADRPWGKTLGTLARRGVTGQLSVRNHNARFQVAFHQGLVIAAASSSGSAESAVNLAFRQCLITPAQLESIQFRSIKGLDDWDLLSECLDPIQVGRLQRQALAGCVARTFVFQHGEFTFDSQITLRVLPNVATHVGGIIYHGARMYLGENRLAAAVRMLGTRFTFRQQEDLRHFGFSEPEMPIIETVLEGTSASSLDAMVNEQDRRVARAAVYALATCGVLHCEAPQTAVGVEPTAPHPVVKRSSPRLARGTSEPGRVAEGTPTPRRTPGYRTSQAESAAAAYARGDAALRAGRLDEALPALERAHELAPEHADYCCTLAWARFCRAEDKSSVASAIRAVLRQAILNSDRPVLPHLYLGRVEQMLGQTNDAVGHFQRVLALEPNHRDASAEIESIAR